MYVVTCAPAHTHPNIKNFLNLLQGWKKGYRDNGSSSSNSTTWITPNIHSSTDSFLEYLQSMCNIKLFCWFSLSHTKDLQAKILLLYGVATTDEPWVQRRTCPSLPTPNISRKQSAEQRWHFLKFPSRSVFLFSFTGLCVCECMACMRGTGDQVLWNWGYRLSWATQYEFWEPHSGLCKSCKCS